MSLRLRATSLSINLNNSRCWITRSAAPDPMNSRKLIHPMRMTADRKRRAARHKSSGESDEKLLMTPRLMRVIRAMIHQQQTAIKTSESDPTSGNESGDTGSESSDSGSSSPEGSSSGSEASSYEGGSSSSSDGSGASGPDNGSSSDSSGTSGSDSGSSSSSGSSGDSGGSSSTGGSSSSDSGSGD